MGCRSHFGRLGAGVVAVVVLLPGINATAQVNSWTSGAAGDWETGANWSLGVPPAISHSAIFITNAASKSISISATTPAGTLTITNLTVSAPGGAANTLALNSATSAPLRILDALTIGANAVLNLTNGSVQVDGQLGGEFELNGTARVRNDATIIITNVTTRIGRGTAGNLNVRGGTVSARNVFVGQGTTVAGDGTLTVSSGTMTLSSLLTVGALAGSTGTVIVAGGDLLVPNFTTQVSTNGVGSITVSDGTMQVRDLHIGLTAGAQGTTHVEGGTLDCLGVISLARNATATGMVWVTGGQVNANPLGTSEIGRFGVGQLTVTKGTVQLGGMYVGTFDGSRGVVHIAGGTNDVLGDLSIGGTTAANGELWVTGGQLLVTNLFRNLNIGFNGTGQMTVSNGTVLARQVSVTASVSAQGTLTMAGGNLTTANFSSLGGGGRVLFHAGEISVDTTSFIANTLPFVVGDTAGATARLKLPAGDHSYADGLVAGGAAGATGEIWVRFGSLQLIDTPITIGDASATGLMVVSNGTINTHSMLVGKAGGTGDLALVGDAITVQTDLTLGVHANSTGTVWMTGGQLVVTNDPGTLTIGQQGVGTMITSNGIVQVRDVVIAALPGALGAWNVSGSTNSVATNLLVGNSACTATGIINLDSGNLFVTNATMDAVLDIRGGTLTMSGGTLAADRIVLTNICSRFIQTGGTLITNVVLLTPGYDADGDGLPNDWEQQTGLDPFSPVGDSGADGDPDGDGTTNAGERSAGTDPLSAASAFRIVSIVREGNDVRVTWSVGGGRTNVLEAATGNVTNAFAPVGTAIIVPGSGDVLTNSLDIGGAAASPARYYRVRIVP